MLNKTSSVLCAALLFLSANALIADNLNYPPKQLEFTPGVSREGGLILKTSAPATATCTSRWNTVTVRVPGRLNYSPAMRLAGTVELNSTTPPAHLGFIVVCSDGKELYCKAPLKTDSPTSFSVKLSDFTIADGAKNPVSPTTEDYIEAIRVYASFREETESTFTLQDFSLLAGGE